MPISVAGGRSAFDMSVCLFQIRRKANQYPTPVEAQASMSCKPHLRQTMSMISAEPDRLYATASYVVR